MSNQSQAHTKKLQTVCQLPYRKLALAIALAVTSTIPITSQAATYTVSNINNSGTGSLRRAVFDANGNAGEDTIQFSIASGSIINLSSELSITDSVLIKGPTEGDANSIVLDGGGNNRLIHGGFPSNSGQTITLENITLRNGFYENGYGPGGGAVYIGNADLLIKHSLITGNST